jgi:hypothetical protein
MNRKLGLRISRMKRAGLVSMNTSSHHWLIIFNLTSSSLFLSTALDRISVPGLPLEGEEERLGKPGRITGLRRALTYKGRLL